MARDARDARDARGVTIVHAPEPVEIAYANASDKYKPLVLLDMDNTLVCSCVPDNQDHPFTKLDHHLDMDTFARPGMIQFIQHLVQGCLEDRLLLGCWSTGSKKYVDAVLSAVFNVSDRNRSCLSLVLTRESTDILDGQYVKDLSRIKHSRVMLIDDSAIHARFYANAKRVLMLPKFCALPQDAEDSCLARVAKQVDFRIDMGCITDCLAFRA